jgi:hypothetical protein
MSLTTQQRNNIAIFAHAVQIAQATFSNASQSERDQLARRIYDMTSTQRAKLLFLTSESKLDEARKYILEWL